MNKFIWKDMQDFVDQQMSCHAGGHNMRVILGLCRKEYLEGQGDILSRLIRGITMDTLWVIGVSLFTKFP